MKRSFHLGDILSVTTERFETVGHSASGGNEVSALQDLAKMLGVAPRHAEDALHCERAAKAVLSRRNLFAAAGAMAAGTVFCPPIEVVASPPKTPWENHWEQSGNPWQSATLLAAAARLFMQHWHVYQESL